MIQIVDLGVRLGDIDALRTVDVSIGAGELVCLAGPNGAGKSTLLRAVVGLVRPTAGVVTVGGAAPGSGEAKQLVGYLPDAPLLYDMLTPREHLEFLDRFWGQATAVPPVDQRLAELGLADVEDRYAARLSLGQRQRLSLGLATYHAPQILLLDEPFNGLDDTTVEMLLRVVEAHIERRGTAIVATHTLGYLGSASRLIVLRDGRLAADTPIDRGTDLSTRYREIVAAATPARQAAP